MEPHTDAELVLPMYGPTDGLLILSSIIAVACDIGDNPFCWRRPFSERFSSARRSLSWLTVE